MMNVKTDKAIGLVISEDVLNINGSLVLPKGITVSPAIAQALLRQGITNIDAEAADGEVKVEVKPKEDSFHEHVNLLFLRHRGPFMKEFQACLLKG